MPLLHPPCAQLVSNAATPGAAASAALAPDFAAMLLGVECAAAAAGAANVVPGAGRGALNEPEVRETCRGLSCVKLAPVGATPELWRDSPVLALYSLLSGISLWTYVTQWRALHVVWGVMGVAQSWKESGWYHTGIMAADD